MKSILAVFALISANAFAGAFEDGQVQFLTLKATYQAQMASVEAPYLAELNRLYSELASKQATYDACADFECGRVARAEVERVNNHIGQTRLEQRNAMIAVEQIYEPLASDLAVETLVKELKEQAIAQGHFTHIVDRGNTSCTNNAPATRCLQVNWEFKYENYNQWFQTSRQFGLTMQCTFITNPNDCKLGLVYVSNMFSEDSPKFLGRMNYFMMASKQSIHEFPLSNGGAVLGFEGEFGSRVTHLQFH